MELVLCDNAIIADVYAIVAVDIDGMLISVGPCQTRNILVCDKKFHNLFF